MSAELGGVPEPVGWLGNRNIIVPPDVIAIRRVSPIPKKKRTPCHPRPEGMPVCRAGGRDWFTDHLFVDFQARDLRNACGTSFTAHASCLVGLLLLLAGPDVTTPVRVSSPLRMPAFVANMGGGAGSLPLLALEEPERSAPPRKELVVKTNSAEKSMAAANTPVAQALALEDHHKHAEVLDAESASNASTESPKASDNSTSETSVGGDGAGGHDSGSLGAGSGVGRGAGEGASGLGMSPGPYRLGHGIEPPRKIKDVAPIYPAGALTARAFGTVVIEATVGVDGKVHETKVLHSIPALDQAALDAVRQWEFSPSRLNGVAVAVIVTVLVQFAIH
jgi:TonB family protein